MARIFNILSEYFGDEMSEDDSTSLEPMSLTSPSQTNKSLPSTERPEISVSTDDMIHFHLLGLAVSQQSPPEVLNIHIHSTSHVEIPTAEMSLSNITLLTEDTTIVPSIEAENDEKIADIIRTGIHEFYSHFLNKIEQTFHPQINVLTVAFSQRLANLFNSIENDLLLEMSAVCKNYSNCLVEFEQTIDNYNKFIDILTEELIKYQKEMNGDIAVLKIQIQEKDLQLKAELNAKLHDRKIELDVLGNKVKIHNFQEMPMSVNFPNNGILLVENKYIKEALALKTEIQKMMTKNYDLEGKIKLENMEAEEELNRREHLNFINKRSLEDMQSVINSLENELQYLEMMKDELLRDHQQDIVDVIEHNHHRVKHYKSEIQYFKKISDNVQVKYNDDMENFAQASNTQSTIHNLQVEDLKACYCEQVTTLTHSVYALKGMVHSQHSLGSSTLEVQTQTDDNIDTSNVTSNSNV